MCGHRRVVFRKCFHYGWGPVISKCAQEKAFDAGLVNEGCSVMVSHPLATLRVDMLCSKCAKNKDEMDEKFAKARECLAVLESVVSKKLKGRVPDVTEVVEIPAESNSGESESNAETDTENLGESADLDETLISPEEVSSFLENKFPMVSLSMDI